jgi:hypothetical protein
LKDEYTLKSFSLRADEIEALTNADAVRMMQSDECVCGAKKKPGRSHCRACYYALPLGKQRALWKKVFKGYLEAFKDSLVWLLERVRPPAEFPLFKAGRDDEPALLASAAQMKAYGELERADGQQMYVYVEHASGLPKGAPELYHPDRIDLVNKRLRKGKYILACEVYPRVGSAAGIISE